MCDTVVVAPEDGPVWLAKNSDREAGEAQAVEWIPASRSAKARQRCTHIEVDVPGYRYATVISRPVWMWGAEMGVNDQGVAIGNEAVFTREPVAPTGLTGMDLLRLALQQADSADAAVQVIIDLLGRYPQGGRMSHRGRLRYHSSFAIADRRGAWILETAGGYWAARRVRGVETISNALTIGTQFDRIHPDAQSHARERGWIAASRPFDFAAAFGDPRLSFACGAAARRAATYRLVTSMPGSVTAERLAAVLSSHAGHQPRDGWRMKMPCAHASWLPTRTAGQTTGSLIVRLDEALRAWATGTSSPCLSVFKPVSLSQDIGSAEPPAGEVADDHSLWWRHERLHRTVLVDYAARSEAIAASLRRSRSEAWAAHDDDAARETWRRHRLAIDDLLRDATRAPRRHRARTFERYWARQSRRDGL